MDVLTVAPRIGIKVRLNNYPSSISIPIYANQQSVYQNAVAVVVCDQSDGNYQKPQIHSTEPVAYTVSQNQMAYYSNASQNQASIYSNMNHVQSSSNNNTSNISRTMSVTLPHNVEPGSVIQVLSPECLQVSINVPTDAYPGQVISVEY